MNNLEEQNDEICVLQSIYTPEELQIVKEDLVKGQFHAFVPLPPNFQVTYKMMELGKEEGDEIPSNIFDVSHLPPITLSFTLPATYPSDFMPDYHVSCPWLRCSQLRKLVKRLHSLWQENSGMVILYIWTQFLKEDSLAYLDISNVLDITGEHINELKRLGKLPDIQSKPSLNHSKGPGAHRSSRKMSLRSKPCTKKVRFSRGQTLNMHLHQYLKAYSEDRAKMEFQRSSFMCDICFSEKMGSNCIQFKPCDHVFCKDCMKSYFEVRIKDGVIHSMPCPYDKCTSEASQSQIREAVGLNLFLKYDRLLLTATLDKMQDITYCPRTVCGCPVMRETDEKMAVCPSCKHVFCVFCKMTYHGVEPCRLKTEEKMKLIQEYEEGDEHTKLKLEKRYGKKQIVLLLDNAKSESWISTNSKPCPKCNVAIEKSDGCNKMSCWKCSSFFCWLCLSTLDPANPYFHYIDRQSRCHQQLFEGTWVLQNDGEFAPDEDEDDFVFYHADFDDDDIEDDEDILDVQYFEQEDFVLL